MSILPNTMKVIDGAGQVATLWGQFIIIILCTVFVLSHNFVLSSYCCCLVSGYFLHYEYLF